MEPVRKTPRSVTPAPPAAAPRPKTPQRTVTAAAALQSRIGASGVRQLLETRRAADQTPGATDRQPRPANDAAPGASREGKAQEPRGNSAPGGTSELPSAPSTPASVDLSGAPASGGGAPTGTQGKTADQKPKKVEGEEKAKQQEPERGAGEPGPGKPAAEVAPVQLHMPEPPTKPSKKTMGRIAGVKRRAGGRAKAQATLPPAGKQVAGAQKAVTPPDAERLAAARAALIAEVQAPPNPAIVKLCERIREVIRSKRPPDEDALAEAKPEEAAKEAGGELNATVASETGKVESNYNALQGSPAAAPAQKGTPLEPQPPAGATAPVNAKAAVPDAVPAERVSLDKDAEEARKRTDAAGMNTPAAALVQSGPIAEAREAQGELDQAAKDDPAKVIARQDEALAQADADMAKLQADALDALAASRLGTAKKLSAGQQGMVGSEEQMRADAGQRASAAVTRAQDLVRGLIKPLGGEAMKRWEAAKTVLVREFKADLSRVEKEIAERHSGVGGAILSVVDWATGLPDWVTRDYNTAEKRFADGVIQNLLTISQYVETIIASCQKIIDETRKEVAGIFAALPASLQEWAKQEQAKFEGQLDNLGKEAADARDSFNKQLTESASQAVDEVRAEIAELRKKAGGLIGRIVDAVKRFVDDPVKFIIEGLLELVGISPAAFWAVVAKIKKVVRDIVDDPIRFANNLLKGIGQGFSLFFDNFAGHMIRGFLTWLLGDLKGVQVPKDFSLKSIITFFLQIMGITWPNIRKILAKKIGEKNVALIEKVWSLVSLLIEKGPEGIFEMIKEKLDPQAILDQVIEMAVEFMVTAIAKQVAARLLLLFNPAGAIVQAIEAIYRVLKWVFQNAARIFTLIETIVNGLADIVAGNVGGFAKAVEKGLAMLIPPVLGFIADYFSLGDLPKTVAAHIKSLQAWVLGMIEKAFDWVIAKGKQLLAALGIGKKEEKDKGGTPNEQAAREVANELTKPPEGEPKNYPETRDIKEKEATELIAKHNPILNPQKMKMTVAFADPSKDQKDNDLDFTVTIAPNTTAVKGATLVAGLTPIGGAHRLERKPPVAGDQSASHHVPAKALRKAIAAVLKSAAMRLEGPQWVGIPVAAATAAKFRAKADKVETDHGTDGMRLSAILLSEKTHEGLHSVDGASALLNDLNTNPAYADMLICRRQTENDLGNYISSNPTGKHWLQFIADVRLQVQGKLAKTDPSKAKPDPSPNVADEILDNAEKTMTTNLLLAEAHVQTHVIDEVQSTLQKSVDKAYTTGLSPVKAMLVKKNEGTAQQQDQAIQDMHDVFVVTWKDDIATIS